MPGIGELAGLLGAGAGIYANMRAGDLERRISSLEISAVRRLRVSRRRVARVYGYPVPAASIARLPTGWLVVHRKSTQHGVDTSAVTSIKVFDDNWSLVVGNDVDVAADWDEARTGTSLLKLGDYWYYFNHLIRTNPTSGKYEDYTVVQKIDSTGQVQGTVLVDGGYETDIRKRSYPLVVINDSKIVFFKAYKLGDAIGSYEICELAKDDTVTCIKDISGLFKTSTAYYWNEASGILIDDKILFSLRIEKPYRHILLGYMTKDYETIVVMDKIDAPNTNNVGAPTGLARIGNIVALMYYRLIDTSTGFTIMRLYRYDTDMLEHLGEIVMNRIYGDEVSNGTCITYSDKIYCVYEEGVEGTEYTAEDLLGGIVVEEVGISGA